MRTIVILAVISVLAVVGMLSMAETVTPTKGSKKVAARSGPQISVRRDAVRFDLSKANYRQVKAARRRNIVKRDPFFKKPKSRGGPFELRVPEGTKLKTPRRGVKDKKEENKGDEGGSTPGAR